MTAMSTITEALSSAIEMIGAIDGFANIMTLALAAVAWPASFGEWIG